MADPRRDNLTQGISLIGLTDSMIADDIIGVVRDDGATRFGNNFIVYKTGVDINPSTTIDEYWAFLDGALDIGTSIQWIIGDMIIFGEDYLDLSYELIGERTGYKAHTIEQFAYVVRNVSIRIEPLKFGHHVLVAARHDGEQQDWLEKAAKKNWSVAELRRQIKGDTLPATVTILTDNTNRLRINRVWRNVARNTLDKIKDDDIPLLRAWLDAIELEKKL